jgi:hypothetical protein
MVNQVGDAHLNDRLIPPLTAENSGPHTGMCDEP